MNNNREPMKVSLIDEIWEEMSSLEGQALDDYLAAIDLVPDDLVKSHASAVERARATVRRARFLEGQRQVRRMADAPTAAILSFDVAKKRKILATIKDHAEQTNEMTIAARNQRIENEKDLDAFLEACLRLGLIDSEGELKRD